MDNYWPINPFKDYIKVHEYGTCQNLLTFWSNHKFDLNWRCHRKYSLFQYKNNRFCRIMSSLCCWAFLLNFLLIAIVNPSLLNPGPCLGKKVSVAYKNVQGLVPFYELGKKNLELNSVKISELNNYLSGFRPNIVMLNDTWLKSCINDSEVICHELNYKLFRRTVQGEPTLLILEIQINSGSMLEEF